jgi:predicted RNase H-like HicB family nuclease
MTQRPAKIWPSACTAIENRIRDKNVRLMEVTFCHFFGLTAPVIPSQVVGLANCSPVGRAKSSMKLLFNIEKDEETGVFVASWDDPQGGGITTQAESLDELGDAIDKAVRCHFVKRTAPRKVVLHFERDLGLQFA